MKLRKTWGGPYLFATAVTARCGAQQPLVSSDTSLVRAEVPNWGSESAPVHGAARGTTPLQPQRFRLRWVSGSKRPRNGIKTIPLSPRTWTPHFIWKSLVKRGKVSIIGEQQTMQLQACSSEQSRAPGSDDSLQLMSYYYLFQQKVKVFSLLPTFTWYQV